jgi:hypothetical protein
VQDFSVAVLGEAVDDVQAVAVLQGEDQAAPQVLPHLKPLYSIWTLEGLKQVTCQNL